MASGSTILKTENITRRLDNEAIPVTLVKDISLEINKGEFVAIMGPSGSGKSSLLYLLGLLDKATAGKISLDGVDVSGHDENDMAHLRLEKLGFVFQFHYLLPEFTAQENVMIPMQRLKKLSDKEIHRRADELLADLGLAEHAHKLPSQMSGGQRQRTAIARALANDPVVILADEPTGNLDTNSTQTVGRILKELTQKRGKTVIVVTHDTHFASTADRIITLVDGQLKPWTP